VLHAAILVEDAYYGRKTNVKPGLIYLRRYNIYFHPYVQNFIKTVVILHMMLALFEGVRTSTQLRYYTRLYRRP
jgi:hypothetical protein